MDRVQENVEKELKKQDTADALSPEDSSAAPNDTVIKEGYTSAVRALTKKASSNVEFVDGLASLNNAFGIRISRDVYRTALRVGPVSSYPSLRKFLAACHHASGRSLTPVDVRALVRIGKLLTLMSSPKETP